MASVPPRFSESNVITRHAEKRRQQKTCPEVTICCHNFVFDLISEQQTKKNGKPSTGYFIPYKNNK